MAVVPFKRQWSPDHYGVACHYCPKVRCPQMPYRSPDPTAICSPFRYLHWLYWESTRRNIVMLKEFLEWIAQHSTVPTVHTHSHTNTHNTHTIAISHPKGLGYFLAVVLGLRTRTTQTLTLTPTWQWSKRTLLVSNVIELSHHVQCHYCVGSLLDLQFFLGSVLPLVAKSMLTLCALYSLVNRITRWTLPLACTLD